MGRVQGTQTSSSGKIEIVEETQNWLFWVPGLHPVATSGLGSVGVRWENSVCSLGSVERRLCTSVFPFSQSLHPLGKNVNLVGTYYPSSQGHSDANHRPLSKGNDGWPFQVVWSPIASWGTGPRRQQADFRMLS